MGVVVVGTPAIAGGVPSDYTLDSNARRDAGTRTCGLSYFGGRSGCYCGGRLSPY